MLRDRSTTIAKALLIIAALTFVASVPEVASANAPGGAYIQCNGGPSSPVRCTPDGW